MKGAFVYYKTEKGGYAYRLKANNKETIAVCGETYTTLPAMKNGIESVRANCEAHVEDLTLKKAQNLTNPKFEVYLDKAGKFRYRLKAKNGDTIAISEEGYASKDGCKKGIGSVARFCMDAEVIDEKDY